MVEWKAISEICYISDYVSNGSFASLRENVQYKNDPDYAILVRVADYSSGFDATKFVYIDEHAYKFLEKSSLDGGEIIMSNVGSCGLLFRCPKLDRKMSLAPNAILIKSDYIDYLYYWLGSNTGQEEIKKITSKSAMPKFNKTEFKKIQVPIPSFSEQQRIVGILDTFTSSIENLKEQIAQRRKQYEYYRDQLLDLEGKEGVEMKNLLDVLAQPITDGPHETPSFYDDGIPFISADAIVDNKINFNRKRGYISEEYDLLCQKKYKPQLNDIYLVKSGSTTGKVAIVRTEERFNIWSPLAAIRVNHSNHPYFVYYLLQTKKVQDQVKLKSSQGSQPNLSMRVLEKFVIPVPSLSEQQRIVSILDTFEASIQNLEAQLKQREKQYEYYRNKLLTFE